MPAQIASSPDRGPCGHRLFHRRILPRREQHKSLFPLFLFGPLVRWLLVLGRRTVVLKWVRWLGSSWDYCPRLRRYTHGRDGIRLVQASMDGGGTQICVVESC
ncbi:hypothetical protein CI102_4333 [Trichoderma harzianum]|uniref:Uncharacterized protein n=1 Tax=Trichoderma harzianum CBS 226.95 TaxID=983964 RepID=A0A2T4AT44_TRIHA|nr:hypothetical protein M431DRAFT_172898 [Trichoderma harzianum CBS 226.95]PKK50207.1 hypothetical protein CI102_4333 [Trichoderma harzianum]PTB60148.1 hypothetical protein M431DRAFT_172898 [Trichoderma harzianum CBS 226.95]